MFDKESKADRYEFTNIGLEDVSLNETRGVEANLMHSPSSTDSATKVKTGLLSGSKHEIFVATSEWVHALMSVRGNPRMAEGTVKVKIRGNLDAAHEALVELGLSDPRDLLGNAGSRHELVASAERRRWGDERVVRFPVCAVPCDAISYTVPLDARRLPFKCIPKIEWTKPGILEVDMRLISMYAKQHVTDVGVLVPLPSEARGVKITCPSTGIMPTSLTKGGATAKWNSKENIIDWRVRRFGGGFEVSVRVGAVGSGRG